MLFPNVIKSPLPIFITPPRGAALEEHCGAGAQYVGDIIYGGLDGIITSLLLLVGG